MESGNRPDCICSVVVFVGVPPLGSLTHPMRLKLRLLAVLEHSGRDVMNAKVGTDGRGWVTFLAGYITGVSLHFGIDSIRRLI